MPTLHIPLYPLELVIGRAGIAYELSGDKWPPIPISLIEAQARDLGSMSANACYRHLTWTR
jgi:hypothetical protein